MGNRVSQVPSHVRGDCSLHFGSHAGTGQRPLQDPVHPPLRFQQLFTPACVARCRSNTFCAWHAVDHALHEAFGSHLETEHAGSLELDRVGTYPEAVDQLFKKCKCPNYTLQRVHSLLQAQRTLSKGRPVVAVVPIRLLFDECRFMQGDEYRCVLVTGYRLDRLKYVIPHPECDEGHLRSFPYDPDIELWSCVAQGKRPKPRISDAVIVN